MKFPQQLRKQLVADVSTVVCELALARNTSIELVRELALAHPFNVTRIINHHRSYGYSHPMWRKERRILPPTHTDGPTWLNVMYDEYGLNDATMDTAIRWAVRNMPTH